MPRVSDELGAHLPQTRLRQEAAHHGNHYHAIVVPKAGNLQACLLTCYFGCATALDLDKLNYY